MKCEVAVQVTFVVHVSDSWPDETPLAQVHRQAEESARRQVAALDPGLSTSITISETRVLDVTLSQDPPF
jgi:hypothetical protein